MVQFDRLDRSLPEKGQSLSHCLNGQLWVRSESTYERLNNTKSQHKTNRKLMIWKFCFVLHEMRFHLLTNSWLTLNNWLDWHSFMTLMIRHFHWHLHWHPHWRLNARPLHCQLPRVPLVPKLTHSGDTRHFEQYEELPKSVFNRRNVEKSFTEEFREF